MSNTVRPGTVDQSQVSAVATSPTGGRNSHPARIVWFFTVSSVFVVQNGVIKQTTIETGEHDGKLIEVVSGLKGDEVLAASSLNELVTGTKVVTADDEGDPPPADVPSADGHGRGGRGGEKRVAEGKGAQ